MLNFRLQEFVVFDGTEGDIPISPAIANKIMANFLLPLNRIRMQLGRPIYVTSCLRPVWWEKMKGRSGDSEHTFKADGACDITVNNDLKSLFGRLQQAEFRRIAYYPGKRFFHLDYKGDDRAYYINRNGWQLATPEQILEFL